VCGTLSHPFSLYELEKIARPTLEPTSSHRALTNTTGIAFRQFFEATGTTLGRSATACGPTRIAMIVLNVCHHGEAVGLLDQSLQEVNAELYPMSVAIGNLSLAERKLSAVGSDGGCWQKYPWRNVSHTTTRVVLEKHESSLYTLVDYAPER
jgi:hypothetical protein